MKILVTNDDGVLAEGLWALVKELKDIAEVIVMAPDREQSAIGTAVTLHHPLRVHRVRPVVPDIETYSVEGTPSDCIILALSMVVGNEIDLIVSGINQGSNLGDDVLISGTVAAALQGYLRGHNALAISAEAVDSQYLDTASRLARLLAQWIDSNALPGNILLNINLPELPLAEISDVKITNLYWLVRHKTDKVADGQTDVWAVEQGNISITPLHTDLLHRSAQAIPNGLCSYLLQGLGKH